MDQAGRMPLVGRTVVHTKGAALIRERIEQLSPTV